LNLVLYRPIRKMLHQRNEKVNGLEKSIQTSLRDVREKDAAFSNGILMAREKGRQEKDAMVNAAAEEEKRIIEAIHRKAQQELDAVRKRIASETQDVRAALQKEIDEFARIIGHKILGRSV